jgi:hypothetical protein
MYSNFKIKAMKTPFNRLIYFGFVLLGIYYTLFQKDYSSAVSTLGIGLAFDPFNPEQPWDKRPMWQKVWLIVHLACVAALFGLMVGLGDKKPI